jgi:hypothetical protein
MTEDRRNDRIVRSWIVSEAPEHAPAQLHASVRTALAVEEQAPRSAIFERRGRVTGPLWTAAAVVLLLVGVTVVGLFGRGREPASTPSPVAPSPSSFASASATPAVSPSASPEPTPSGVPLAAGPWASTRFHPALRMTMPDGWVLVDDRPLAASLSATTAGSFTQTDGAVYFDGIYLYSGPLAGSPDGTVTPVAGVGTKAKDLAMWLSRRPQLVATAPNQVRLGGRVAWLVDLRLSPDAGALCGIPCVHLLNSPDRNGSYAMGIEGPWAVRAIFVDAPNGETLAVTIQDTDGSGLAAEVDAAQPIVDSIAFP